MILKLNFCEYQLDAIQFDLRYLTTLFFPSYHNTIYLSIDLFSSYYLLISFPPRAISLRLVQILPEVKSRSNSKIQIKKSKHGKETLENCLFDLIQLKTSSFASASKINVNKHLFAWNEIQMNKSCTSSTN